MRTLRGVVSQGVLLVAGGTEEGSREILAVTIANSESKTSWSELFKSLKERGLSGVEFIVSDDHEGLVKAAERYFAGSVWQRCQAHFMRNILDKIAQADRAVLKADMRSIFNAPNKERSHELLSSTVERYQNHYPVVSDMLEEAADDILACYGLPEGHRKRLRTTNLLERYNQEIKRRTKVVRIFPNEEAALRLISALAAEQSEEWLSGRKYLDMSTRENNASEVKKELVLPVPVRQTGLA